MTLHVVPRPAGELEAHSEAALSGLVARAFSMRRKTLRNTLAGVISADELERIGIDPGKRAQELPVAAFVTIVNRLTGGGTGPRQRRLAK